MFVINGYWRLFKNQRRGQSSEFQPQFLSSCSWIHTPHTPSPLRERLFMNGRKRKNYLSQSFLSVDCFRLPLGRALHKLDQQIENCLPELVWQKCLQMLLRYFLPWWFLILLNPAPWGQWAGLTTEFSMAHWSPLDSRFKYFKHKFMEFCMYKSYFRELWKWPCWYN